MCSETCISGVLEPAYSPNHVMLIRLSLPRYGDRTVSQNFLVSDTPVIAARDHICTRRDVLPQDRSSRSVA